MSTLLDLKKKQKEEGASSIARKILIIGKPKSGKTVLASTIAKSPEVQNIYYFDTENSVESIVEASENPELEKLALSDQELQKIIHINIPDTKQRPLAAETLLKCFTAAAEQPAKLCVKHGKVACTQTDCTDDRIGFSLFRLKPTDVVIVDSGSQLADSIFNLGELLDKKESGRDKNLMQLYQLANLDSNAIMSAIQAAPCTVILVSHLLDIYSTPKDLKEEPQHIETVPLFGSKNYSKNKISKYFGWVILTEIRNGQFLIGSSPHFKKRMDLGNRKGVKIESYPDFTLDWVFKPVAEWPQPSSNTGLIKVKKR